MKFVCVCYIIGCSALLVEVTQGAPNIDTRGRRSLSIEMCPENSSTGDCADYADRKSKSIPFCHTYELDPNRIHWEDCGQVFCGGNTRLIKEDLRKPYPDCCEQCVIIDKDKDAYFSGTL